jgi:hypothetical protein
MDREAASGGGNLSAAIQSLTKAAALARLRGAGTFCRAASRFEKLDHFSDLLGRQSILKSRHQAGPAFLNEGTHVFFGNRLSRYQLPPLKEAAEGGFYDPVPLAADRVTDSAVPSEYRPVRPAERRLGIAVGLLRAGGRRDQKTKEPD